MTTQDLPANLLGSDVPATLHEEIEAAKSFARDQHAGATRQAYRSDFRIFQAWCAARSLPGFPAEPATISAFIAAEAKAGVKASTITRRLAAIRYAHVLAGHEPPTNSEVVKATMKGIRRNLGTAPMQKAPATAQRLALMANLCPDDLRGLRDRALLLLGFAGAFRRSELVALSVDDLEETDKGLRVRIHRSKTDQEGAGHVIAVLRGERSCPVAAVRAWLEAAAITTGPVFRPFSRGGRPLGRHLTPKSVAIIVKRYAELAGLDPALFAGHSLRAGFLTSAAANRASLFKMMDVSRHKSVDTLRGYVRRAEEFENHAGAGLL